MASRNTKASKADITEDSLRNANYAGQIEAINRAQSVIQFELDGTIVTANENFLSMMGYELDEIVGQHHRIFADPGFAASAEYTEFWAALGRGEYQAAEYKRIGKGGKEVWIQATYNPIIDRDGKPYKVVKFSTDITEDSLRQRQLCRTGRSDQQVAVGDRVRSGRDDSDRKRELLVDDGLRARRDRRPASQNIRRPGFAASAEYREFWAALGRGEYQAAEYKRIGKGGREVWIQATYNRIIDRDGKPYKVVKFSTDITERKEAEAVIDAQGTCFWSFPTPAIQLWDEIVLMPLIGQIDSERATTLIERLLDAITERSATVAILDVTGVPVIDTTFPGIC